VGIGRAGPVGIELKADCGGRRPAISFFSEMAYNCSGIVEEIWDG